LHSSALHERCRSIWLLEGQIQDAAWRWTGIIHARLSQIYFSTSWNKVFSSLNCWLFLDQHIGRVFFWPLGNECNSSCTRQTTNLHWHPNNTSCHWCLGKSQQLLIYCNSKGLHSTDNNDSTPRIWMHHYSRFGDCTKYWVVYDHHWIPSKLFMFLLQGNAYKIFRQARPMDKLQASVLHLHPHM
jgi:hypothetical protein